MNPPQRKTKLRNLYRQFTQQSAGGLTLLTLLTLALTFGATAPVRHGPPPSAKEGIQGVAVPAYFGPGPLWTKMGSAAGGTRVLAILNPNSGPGEAVRADYVTQLKTVRARGVVVLGYIHTSYGKRPLAEVRAEIESYHRFYGVSDIFFDEVSNTDDALPYYRDCQRAARAGYPKARVVINPGTTVTEGYMAVADIVVTFESDYAAYVKRAPDPAWVRRFPAERFFHLVYAAPDAAALANAVRLSKARRAGWVYVTPDNLPNPWDTLPETPYWDAELAALTAAK